MSLPQEDAGLKKRGRDTMSRVIEPPTSQTFQNTYSGFDDKQYSFNGYLNSQLPETQTNSADTVTFNPTVNRKGKQESSNYLMDIYSALKEKFNEYWSDPESKDQLITFSLYATIILCCVACVFVIGALVILGVGGTYVCCF